jgi:hypothetical protein
MYPEQPAKPGPGTQVQVNNVIPTISEEDREEIRRLALARLGEVDPPASTARPDAADGQALPVPRSGPGGRGDGAGQLAEAGSSGAVSDPAAPALRTEQPVLPLRRTEQPVLPVLRTGQPVPAGPPGPGEERSICLGCGRRYLRRPGFVFHCPECNA